MMLMLPAFNKNQFGKFPMSKCHSVILQWTSHLCWTFWSSIAYTIFDDMPEERSGRPRTGMKYAGLGTRS